MDIITKLDNIINTNNKKSPYFFSIDTIRAEFRKVNLHGTITKIEKIHQIANKYGDEFQKLKPNSDKFHKLKHYIHDKKTLTSLYHLDNDKIYYYNTNAKKKTTKYRFLNAMLVIYGITQYHHAPPNKALCRELLKIANNLSSIDVCFDTDKPLNLEKLKNRYGLKDYKNSHYINNQLQTIQELGNIVKICIYDKQVKNSLGTPLNRVEATIKMLNLNQNLAISKDERLEFLHYDLNIFEKFINEFLF